MFKKYIIGLLFVSLILLFTEAIGQYDVEYEPSSHDVVALMLNIANVTGEDIVYDLGCGDGRIVITATKQYGAQGVGIDIDPIRISEGNNNAKKEGVTGKVRFIEQDLFEADIGEATVVTFFLLPSVNLRLRPKLFRDLEPGTRIVSHEHYMGAWEPDLIEKVVADGRSHTVYLWILPANVSGTWDWTESTEAGKRSYNLHIEQEFQEVNGILSSNGANVSISEMTIEGDKLRIAIEEETGIDTMIRTLDGTSDGNVIKGTVVSKTETGVIKNRWRAKRDPSTIVSLDK